MTNEAYYYENEKYSDYLDNQDSNIFNKIVNIVRQYTQREDSILDVGCGSGKLLSLISDRENKFGIDISNNSIQRCLDKKLDCLIYNGKKIPFGDGSFDLVLSFNVLEHVDDPNYFLLEQLRVLKSKGYLMIICPNFLSITNNFHWHTSGLVQKIYNLKNFAQKFFHGKFSFEKMKVIDRDDFHPDDDACNITNPLDLLRWAKEHKLTLKYWSSQPTYTTNKIISILDKTWAKIFLGANFFIFKK
ncbi:MAG: hypothetical protein A3D35_02445 [Candidatus Staskawiczbacteria bacterium RIFCSPHIGHO2_02_FULL_34_9]|uniref:Methyltransferase type 11 domain-containing protein n=1 Tax=Candidatus Staskawiczbacteria bacterium RIFCSPHIGHO2_02_FULL_34_9 TaxID=1802206 RepID=A0A1G2HYP8_9BACT|nr:MAG: hypothetical protein A3D35_02445 [Candidatus Staskawiczbacteria bacterium RIFCSPHIGHO2_02_FULL_34_9]